MYCKVNISYSIADHPWMMLYVCIDLVSQVSIQTSNLPISVPHLFDEKQTEVKPNTQTYQQRWVTFFTFVILLPDCLKKQAIPLKGYPEMEEHYFIHIHGKIKRSPISN